ncbi:MAG: alkane 1-monooxygenase, partial [Bryobacterales bacterium]|nr:alkane 1-monooxygenase [Bryobacterales bacterium]
MAESSAARYDAGVGTGGRVEPSFLHALPYFTPVAVLLLLANAAVQGSWWMAVPLVFFLLAEPLDKIFGIEERNMDPAVGVDSRLAWYQAALWSYVALWPLTLVFVFWQILAAGHLATWEVLVMAIVLGNVATIILVAGHEVIHERTIWQRRLGEFLLGSVCCAQYASEHVYVHHAWVGTPHDPMTARKGQSLWQYLPRAWAGSMLASWRTVRERLALRRRSMWHYTNPFWRYALCNGSWLALAYWMGGVLGIAVFAIQSAYALFLLRVGDYVEHYGLVRLCLPSGRFERAQPWHSWNAVSKFSNWLYYNTQRHSDHHDKPTRVFPLPQNQAAELAPRMPGGYAKVFNLALSPRRWFATMDPYVDQWRARFYPQVRQSCTCG